MKYLVLLALAFFVAVPHPAQAAATCTTTECLCTLEGSEWYSNSYVETDATACRTHCDDFVNTGTANWRFTCKLDGVEVPSAAGQGTIEQIDNVSPTDTEEKRDPVIPFLNVPIPGLDFGDSVTYDAEGNLQANFLAKYIDALYRFLIVAMAIVAVVMMMIGGLQYILARGHADAVKKAKERMANSVIGIILLLAAYNIAFLINPDTVRFESLSIKTLQYEEVTAELFEEMQSYGQTGAVADADVIAIPSDAASSHIVVYTREKKIAQATYDALRAAATEFYTTTLADNDVGQNIRLTSASRTLQSQAEKFYENCIATGGYCSTDTCNPNGSTTTVVKRVNGKYTLQGDYASMSSAPVIAFLVQNSDARNCYHTNNVAVDVWPEDGGGKSGFNIALMNQLTTAMIKKGFCRIPNEPWHFELAAKASPSCSTSFKTADYTRKLNGISTTFSMNGCATWSYTSSCCVAAIDNASKPATMCK